MPALPGLKGNPVITTGYLVHDCCHLCGHTHLVSAAPPLPDGLTQLGTLADLYGSADLPRTLANLLNDLVWCDQAAAYIQLQGVCLNFLGRVHFGL